MANLFAQNTATWDSANMWNTAANGSGSYQTPVAGDVCMANGKTVTVNISPTVAEVRNDTTGSATAGGYFDLANGVTLTANAYGGSAVGQCIRFNGSAPNQAYFVGTATAGTVSCGALNANTGTLNILAANGSVQPGSVNSSTGTIVVGTATASAIAHNGHGCNNASSGTVSATSAFGSSNGYISHGVNNGSTGSATVTSATGGAGSNVGGNLCLGCNNATSGSLTVTTATGGSGWGAYGAFNVGTGSLIVDLAVGNDFGPGGSHTQSTPGVYGSVSGTLGRTTVNKIRSGAHGQAAIGGAVFLAPDANSTGEFLKTNLSTKTMYVSESASLGYPANANVRNGTVFDGGSRTGTCYVPAAASVLYGVPVDATTGTATLAAADIRSALGLASANLDTQLSNINTKTTNLPASPAAIGSAMTLTSAYDAAKTAASQTSVNSIPTTPLLAANYIAPPSVSAIRTEMDTNSTKLANLDATISSRLAAADYGDVDLSAVLSAIAALHDFDPATDTVAHVTLVDTTTTLTNAPDVPTESEIADAVRTELTPELAAVLAMETRMAEQVPTGPVIVIPPPGAGQTTAWIVCYDETGKPEPGVTITITCTKASASGAFDAGPVVLTSDEDGLASGEIPRGTGLAFSAKRGKNGNSVRFAGVDADTLALPPLLGSP